MALFIDHKAGEIIRLVASVHPSVRPSVDTLTYGVTSLHNGTSPKYVGRAKGLSNTGCGRCVNAGAFSFVSSIDIRTQIVFYFCGRANVVHSQSEFLRVLSLTDIGLIVLQVS